MKSHLHELIKTEKPIESKEGFIPCLFMPYLLGSSKIVIYFHGNAEDIGLSMELLIFVRDMLKVSFPSDNWFVLGACASDGVPGLRHLRWQPRGGLDSNWFFKRIRLFDLGLRHKIRSDHFIWPLNWLGSSLVGGIKARPMRVVTDESIHVNQRNFAGQRWRHDGQLASLRSFPQHRQNAWCQVPNILCPWLTGPADSFLTLPQATRSLLRPVSHNYPEKYGPQWVWLRWRPGLAIL